MWMRVLGKSEWASLGVLLLAISLGLGHLEAGYAGETPVAKPVTPPPAGESEIIFNGKLFCSLKRRVDLPFKGIITSLRVNSGQQVEAGDILATYRLAPEAVMAIQQRLSPPQLADLEMKLTELERSMVPLKNKQKELSQLVEKKLAPAQSLAHVNQELNLLGKEKSALQERLQKDRHLAQQDQEVLGQLLGGSVKSGQVPRDVSLKSPISGYVISVNPEIRVDAELPPMPAAFQVGVMNPMLVRAHAFEIEALQIKVGDQAELTLDALPGRKFQAQVNRISWSSITAGPEQPAYYEVELKVPNPDLSLKEGLKTRILLHKSP